MSDYDPDEATAREDMCRFLSACFYEPGPEFAEEDLFGSMLIAAGKIHPDLANRARALGEAFSSEDVQALLVDYTRLFLGPLQALASPYASSWLNTAATSGEPASSAVLEHYRAGGLDLDEEFNDLPDHIAVELEFLYLLTFKRHDAERAGQTEEQSALADLECQFLKTHLGAWVTPFASAVKSGAQTAFYRELAELTERFICLEQARPGNLH
ncbi:MAG TPA: molecular chaperone TorD family protein [Noviherbaspirillum sp.]